MLREKHREWLAGRGFDQELAEKFGLTTTQREGRNWISVPYVEHGKVVNHKYRLTSAKDHRMDSGAPLVLWNHDVLLDPNVQAGRQSVIVTEGEWDALTAISCGFPHTVSVPNGTARSGQDGESGVNDPESASYQYLWRSRQLLDNVGEFIIATDADAPGRALAADLVSWFGPERCKLVDYPEGCKDLNELLALEGGGGVVQAIHAARPYPVKGLYRISDFPEPAYHEPLRLQVPGLYDLLPIVPGTLTIITGHSGQGKTSLIMAMIADMLKSGIRVALGSFETMPRPILQRRLRACLIRASEKELQDTPREPIARHLLPQVKAADQLLNEKLSVIAQQPSDDDSEMTLEEVLDLARIAVLRDGVKVVILDPWNEIEHKAKKGEDKLEYASRAIRMLKRFARNFQVAVWLVAHPKKLENPKSAPGLSDISGSNDFRNKADYGLVVHRPNKQGSEVDVHNVKVRMGLPGREDSITLMYDFARSSYERAPTIDLTREAA